jgi:hypothetical protein
MAVLSLRRRARQRPDRMLGSKDPLEEHPHSIVKNIALFALAETQTVLGRYSGGVTPVPIPNTAVKPSSADGTVPEGGTGE